MVEADNKPLPMFLIVPGRGGGGATLALYTPPASPTDPPLPAVRRAPSLNPPPSSYPFPVP